MSRVTWWFLHAVTATVYLLGQPILFAGLINKRMATTGIVCTPGVESAGSDEDGRPHTEKK